MKRLIPLCAAIALVAGCATTPQPLSGEFSAVTPEQARQGDASGQVIRWGGEIVDVRPLENRTCLEIMSRELGGSARPRETDRTLGRFIACKPGFIDPAAFKPGREVTVVGAVEGVDSGKIGEFEYRFPHVAADTVYLWPERREYDDRHYYHRPFLYDPFFWPYPFYYSHWYHPWGPHYVPKSQNAPAGES